MGKAPGTTYEHVRLAALIVRKRAQIKRRRDEIKRLEGELAELTERQRIANIDVNRSREDQIG